MKSRLRIQLCDGFDVPNFRTQSALKSKKKKKKDLECQARVKSYKVKDKEKVLTLKLFLRLQHILTVFTF